MMYKIIQLFVLSCTIFCTSLYAGDTSNLEGAWLLNEESGTRVDETANNNDLTDNNTVGQATGVNCKFDECADFELANSEYLSITDGSQTGLDLTGNFTLLAWFKAESNPGSTLGLAKDHAGSGYAGRITGLATNFLIAGVQRHAGGSIVIDTFSHVTWIYNGSTAAIRIDGSTTSTANTTNASNTASGFSLASSSTGSLFFDGIMDDAAVFSRALSDAEVDDIKDNGLTAFISGPVRNRVVSITGLFGLIGFYINQLDSINTHRIKFNINRPIWMRIFDRYINFQFIPNVYAAPTEVQNKLADDCLYSVENSQINYLSVNKQYEQVKDRMYKRIICEVDVYNGSRGMGYIATAKTVLSNKVWIKQNHVGPEIDRQIETEWVQREVY